MTVEQHLPPRPNGHPHLSECLQVVAWELDWVNKNFYRCTCDDDSPEWTT